MSLAIDSVSLWEKKLVGLATSKDVGKLREESVKLKKQLMETRSELQKIRQDLVKIDNDHHRKNLVITGIRANDNNEQAVQKFFGDVLNVSPPLLIDVPLTKGEKAKLLVKFVRGGEVFNVRRGASEFCVSRDYSSEVLNVRGKLFQVRKEIFRVNNNIRSTVRADTLLVEKENFNWSHDIGLTYGGVPGIDKLKIQIGADIGKFIESLCEKGAPDLWALISQVKAIMRGLLIRRGSNQRSPKCPIGPDSRFSGLGSLLNIKMQHLS